MGKIEEVHTMSCSASFVEKIVRAFQARIFRRRSGAQGRETICGQNRRNSSRKTRLRRGIIPAM